jgi:transposase
MKALEPLEQRIAQLDATTFRNYLIAFFGALALILGLIMWRYYASVSSIHKNIRRINDEREQVKDITIRSERVKEQQRLVEALIKKDPSFKILGYFDRVLNEHRLMGNLVRRPETRSTELDTGHTEVTLIANLTGLTMKTIAELLDTLERNERINTKDIEITKPLSGRTVNLSLTIATLEPSSQAVTEPTEE